MPDVTSFADDDALFAAILAGASGYLLKQIRGPELVSAVRGVAAGQSLIDQHLPPVSWNACAASPKTSGSPSSPRRSDESWT